jgi:hypothetical protein
MRYHGNAPILGFRVGSIFHIVAIDHKFEAYEH